MWSETPDRFSLVVWPRCGPFQRSVFSLHFVPYSLNIKVFFCFSETHMIYQTMYNDDQKYSSCVCLDENPEMEKKKRMS